MRYLLLLLLALPLVAVDDSPRVNPTTVDRVQGSIDATTGKIEQLTIFDANEAVDPTGTKVKIGERATILKRADAPALFAQLDLLVGKTAERDDAHKKARAPKVEAPAVKALKP